MVIFKKKFASPERQKKKFASRVIFCPPPPYISNGHSLMSACFHLDRRVSGHYDVITFDAPIHCRFTRSSVQYFGQTTGPTVAICGTIGILSCSIASGLFCTMCNIVRVSRLSSGDVRGRVMFARTHTNLITLQLHIV